MGRPYVKGGTPVGSASLCKTCTNAHIMIGYRESEVITMCNDVHPNIVVPFSIYDCTGYYDKNRPSWKEMKELAITVTPGTLKPVGFKTGPGFGQSLPEVRVGPGPAEDDDED